MKFSNARAGLISEDLPGGIPSVEEVVYELRSNKLFVDALLANNMARRPPKRKAEFLLSATNEILTQLDDY